SVSRSTRSASTMLAARAAPPSSTRPRSSASRSDRPAPARIRSRAPSGRKPFTSWRLAAELAYRDTWPRHPRRPLHHTSLPAEVTASSPQNEHLRVLARAMGEGNRMIGRVARLGHHHGRSAGVGRRGRHDVAEGAPREVLRARRGEQVAPGGEAAERLQVHILVSAQARLEIAAPAHEGRRIDDDQVVALAVAAQKIEYVGGDKAGLRRIEAVLDPRRLTEP